MSFLNAPIEQIAKFLADNKGKPAIVHESLKGKTITLIHNKKVPMREALSILEEAMREGGMVIEESGRLVRILPFSAVKQMTLAVVPDGTSVDTIGEPTKIVDKVFVIKHYDIARIKDVIVPMLAAYGHVTADPNTNTLIVTDCVANLKRVEQLVTLIDVAGSDLKRTEVYQVAKGDAAEIVAIISNLLKGIGKDTKDITAGTGRSGPSMPGMPGGPSMPPGMGDMSPMGPGGPGGPGGRSGPPKGGEGAAGSVTVVTLEVGKSSIVMMPDIVQNRIIVVAPQSIQDQIREWVAQLDQSRKSEEMFAILDVKFADVDDICTQITRTLDSLPQADFKQGIKVTPFVLGRKIMVTGSKQGRQFVKDLLDKMDVEGSSNRITQVFSLKNADAEQVSKDIEALFSGRQLQYKTSYYESYSFDRNAKMKVTCDSRRNTITVITDAETMAKIQKIIVEEWDRAIEAGEVEPKIYVLRCADPVQVRDLLESMFSKKQKSMSLYDMFYGGGSSSETTPVGRLFGQFSFQALANSNQLVVTTKNKANYLVIDRIVEQLDQPQESGLPHVFELKHANAEDLAEQLNAMLSETGTLAQITRQQRGLTPSNYSLENQPPSDQGTSPNPYSRQQPNQQQPTNNTSLMTFWWQVSRTKDSDKSAANSLIGKIRIVPIVRRNALMVMAPMPYLEQVAKLIDELDQPGLQVMVHAIIVEIQHDDVTSLGVRFAADPTLLQSSDLTDQSIGSNLSGKGTSTVSGFYGIGDNGSTTFTGLVNVSAILQLLKEKFKMKVLFEPKLFTADNMEAEFFDGQQISVQQNIQSSPEGTSINRSFYLKSVGTLLRVRPHITKEGGVDLKVSLELSRVVPGLIINNNVVFDLRETMTHVILQDGQTVVISGIVRQEDFLDDRKLPLLGDIPLIGLLFHNKNMAKRNLEMVAFITPHVVTNTQDAQEQTQPSLEMLERARQQMGPLNLDGVSPSRKVPAKAGLQTSAPAEREKVGGVE